MPIIIYLPGARAVHGDFWMGGVIPPLHRGGDSRVIRDKKINFKNLKNIMKEIYSVYHYIVYKYNTV